MILRELAERDGHERDSGPATAAPATLTKKDFKSDQETRWCPGCGDYAILAAVQALHARARDRRRRRSSSSPASAAPGRFAYYMDTYGMHGIHGRAPALATGLATARPDLSVWVVTGDGDALSIGGNHLIHALRRNVPIKILLFNNQIYGLTKGQYSPTSEVGKVTKSTPFGSLDHPFNPLALALGAEATFVARTIDVDKQHLAATPARGRRAPGHGVRRDLPELQRLQRRRLRRRARQGRAPQPDPARARRADPLRRRGERGVVRGRDGGLEVVDVAEVGEDALVVHDAHRDGPEPRLRARPLAERPTGPTPIGVLRDSRAGPSTDPSRNRCSPRRTPAHRSADVDDLLRGGDTWNVE